MHEAFAPGVQIADMARRRDVSRAQIYQWRAALREGRLTGTDAVGFVPVEMAGPEPRPTDALTADLPVEIALACGRGLKVPSSLLTAGAAAVDPRGGGRMIGPGTGVRIYLACAV